MYIFIECVDWINENENTLIWNVGLLLYCSNLGQTFNRWPALNQYITQKICYQNMIMYTLSNNSRFHSLHDC